jgi:hypothetical protein
MAQVLHVLLPGRDKLAAIPAFGEWLARGTRLPAAVPGYLVALSEHFRWPNGALPAAALIRQSVAGDAGDALWLSADPAWVQPEVSGARLLAIGNLGLTVDDAASLVAALAETFEAQGMTLQVGDAQHWQVRLPAYVDVPPFPEPEDALGADLFEQLPKGDAGRQWRALLNEAQVVLHNHPVNRRRAAEGLPPVNSVWLWGAGALPEWVESGLSHIYSDDLLVWSLAHRADVDVHARAGFSGGQGVSIDLLDLQDVQPVAFGRDWWPAIEARLASGAEVRLAFADGVRVALHKRHRLRFWRKA